MKANVQIVEVLRQHLIDPEICIRCNTCEETCPVDAITHDSRNYVVDATKCNFCNECISPCPTGAIDNWRQVDRANPYSIAEQLTWGSLPAQAEISTDAGAETPDDVARIRSVATAGQGGDVPPPSALFRREPMPTAGRITCVSIRSRARAMASGRATTICRSP